MLPLPQQHGGGVDFLEDGGMTEDELAKSFTSSIKEWNQLPWGWMESKEEQCRIGFVS